MKQLELLPVILPERVRRWLPQPKACRNCGEVDCVSEMCDSTDHLHFMRGDLDEPTLEDLRREMEN